MNFRLTYKILSAFVAILTAMSVASAQSRFGSIVELDKTVHDFGDVLTTDGPLSCHFTVTNISAKPVNILTVVSSCGCTDVTWTKEPIPAGGTGTISATYQNEDGPFPFDKTLTVYFAEYKQPVILRLRGVVNYKPLPVKETYKIKRGDLGFKEDEIKGGNMSQGQQKSGEFMVANIGSKPIKVTFKDTSKNLKISVFPTTIPAGETAKVSYTIDADRSLWGKNYYWFTPVVDGRAFDKMGIWAVTKEDFTDWSREQRANGSNVLFKSNSFEFKPMAAGKTIEAVYDLSNVGKSDLIIYKVDTDNPKAVPVGDPPVLKPGQGGKLRVNLDTKGMPKGEVLVIVSLTTNSPLRPLVNLFITGFIQ
ncbi:MAG: DUF1573 domain-containing protein [Bacteroidales bacterium]|nr:DUF1573 domain-containing protein [Bacteroidales bacterium]